MPVDFKLPLLRRPLPADLDHTAPMALRMWMTQLVAGEFASNGHVVPRLRLVFPTHIEEAPLTDLPDDPAWGAAVWDELADRADVLCSFRIGVVELAAPNDDGTPNFVPRRCACVLERRPGGEERWWLGFWVLPEVLDRSATVSWFGQEGEGFVALPPPLRAWVDAGGRTVGVEARPLDAGNRPPEPRLMVHFAELAVPAPTDLTGLGRLAERMLRDPELVGLVVTLPPVMLVLRERTVERWQSTAPLPCTIDDLARNVCALGDPPDGVVVIDRAPAVGGEPAYRVSVERRGERLTRTWVPSAAPPWRDPVRVEIGDHGWIGVAPATDLGLTPESYPGVTPGGADYH